jgi:hypothetical protein
VLAWVVVLNTQLPVFSGYAGKGAKNFKKGKKRDEGETRRDLLFKEDGQGGMAKMISHHLSANFGLLRFAHRIRTSVAYVG